MRLNRFSKEEAENLLNEIREYKDIIELKLTSYNRQIRYKVEDETLQDFLIYCSHIITILVHVIKAYFFFHFKKHEDEKEQWEERRWFYDIVGDEIANSFFRQVEKNHAEKKTIQNLYIEFSHYDNKFPKVETKNL
jgi:hypothetical protein